MTISALGPDIGCSLSTLRLLQLCSPAFPIGAFAYSQGLEQAIERQWIRNPPELRAWLHGVLTHNLALTDLPLLQRAMEMWQQQAPAGVDTPLDEHGPSLSLCRTMLSYRETSEVRSEERQLGRALARVLSHLGVHDAAPYIDHPDASYVVLFGLAATRFGITPHDASIGFAFAWLENQVSAATRVMRLGQLSAQEVLSSLLQEVVDVALQARAVSDDELGFSGPGMALSSSWHEEQYSRLFRS